MFDFNKSLLIYVGLITLVCLALFRFVYSRVEESRFSWFIGLSTFLTALATLILGLNIPQDYHFWPALVIVIINEIAFLVLVYILTPKGDRNLSSFLRSRTTQGGILVILLFVFMNFWLFESYDSNNLSDVTIKVMLNNTDTDDQKLARLWEEDIFEKFTQDKNKSGGAKVESLPVNSNSGARLAELLDMLKNPNSPKEKLKGTTANDINVFAIDVIWPTILNEELKNINYAEDFNGNNLKKRFEKKFQEFFPAIIDNNKVKVNGKDETKLIAVPWYIDMGLLFYRKDLLERYRKKLEDLNLIETDEALEVQPPKTWDELTEIAKEIQKEKRSDGSSGFYGFVWQGKSYEGLTCNALEWMASHGGGTILDKNNKFNINKAEATTAFKRARDWLSAANLDKNNKFNINKSEATTAFKQARDRISAAEISPPYEDVSKLDELQALRIWLKGNAAFMRHWPYAYLLSRRESADVSDEVRRGVGVTLLPKGNNAHPASTLGGWQLMINPNSKPRRKEAAIRLVEYLTDEDRQMSLAIETGKLPTLKNLYDKNQLKDELPFIRKGRLIKDKELKEIFENIDKSANSPSADNPIVMRPSRATGKHYPMISEVYSEGISKILQSQKEEELKNLVDALIKDVEKCLKAGVKC